MNIEEINKHLQQITELQLIGPLANKNKIKKYPSILVDTDIQVHLQQMLPFCIKIGDNDSSQNTADILLPTNKDVTDLEYTLSILPDNIRRIHAVGFYGGELDHQLIVISAFYRLIKKNSMIEVYLDDKMILLAKKQIILKYHGHVSIMMLETCTISISGDVDFSLTETTLEPLTGHTISNYARGIVEINSNQPLIIFAKEGISYDSLSSH